MKKSTLLFFLALLPIGLWAQDSGEEVGRRVLSLGRSWNYKRKTADGTTETVSLTLLMLPYIRLKANSPTRV